MVALHKNAEVVPGNKTHEVEPTEMELAQVAQVDEPLTAEYEPTGQR